MKRSLFVSIGVVVLVLVAGTVWFVSSGDDGGDDDLIAMRLAKLPEEIDPDAS